MGKILQNSLGFLLSFFYLKQPDFYLKQPEMNR